MRFSAAELTAHLDGELVGPDVSVEGASIDSRTIRPGQLYAPIVAERDGHAFVPAALEAGPGAHPPPPEPAGGAALPGRDTPPPPPSPRGVGAGPGGGPVALPRCGGEEIGTAA